MDQKVAATKVNGPVVASSSIGSLTLEPPSKIALGGYSEDDCREEVFYSLSGMTELKLGPHDREQLLRDLVRIEPLVLEGSCCMDLTVATTMVKVSDAAAGSSLDSVTREPTSETGFGDSSEDDGPEEVSYSLSEVTEIALSDSSEDYGPEEIALGDSCEDDGPEEVALADSSPDDRPKEIALGDSSEDDSHEEVFYSLSELQDPKLWKCNPDIAELPHEREQFLAPDIFEVVFGMSKDDFTKLPVWRQSDLKKQHQLF